MEITIVRRTSYPKDAIDRVEIELDAEEVLSIIRRTSASDDDYFATKLRNALLEALIYGSNRIAAEVRRFGYPKENTPAPAP